VRAVVALIALTACATTPTPPCATYYAPSPQHPFLWKVSGPHGSLVVFATHQAATPADVPQAAWAELDKARAFVTEAEEVPGAAETRDRGQWNEAFYLPRGSSLQKLLSDDDYFELKRHVDGPVNNYKPWVALLKLTGAAYRWPSPTIADALVERAHARKLAVEYLETWEEQVRYLDEAVTADKLAEMIHDYPRIECVMTNRLAAFRAGDDAVFVNEIASPNEPVVPRIDRWLVRLDEYLAGDRRTFVAIGIGQLVGPYGILTKLAARGYSVQRL